jgi:hypothetical protein
MTSKRTVQYADDPAYRQRIKTYSRELMQARRGTKLVDCRENLADLADFGTRRTAYIADEPHNRLSFTIGEAAEALMVTNKLLRVWIKEGTVPAPVVPADLGNGQQTNVYIREEMRTLLNLIGRHRSQCAVIRASHHGDLIARVAAKVKLVRINTGVIDG